MRAVQLRGRSRTSIAQKPRRPITRKRADVPRRIHLANAMITQIRDVHIARPIHKRFPRAVQLRGRSRTSIAQKPRRPITRKRADIPRHSSGMPGAQREHRDAPEQHQDKPQKPPLSWHGTTPFERLAIIPSTLLRDMNEFYRCNSLQPNNFLSSVFHRLVALVFKNKEDAYILTTDIDIMGRWIDFDPSVASHGKRNCFREGDNRNQAIFFS